RLDTAEGRCLDDCRRSPAHISPSPPPSSFHRSRPPTALHSFPTRRSSDLPHCPDGACPHLCGHKPGQLHHLAILVRSLVQVYARDRKSTRLNSSHVSISYAVFCLKKKNDSYYMSHISRSPYCLRKCSFLP